MQVANLLLDYYDDCCIHVNYTELYNVNTLALIKGLLAKYVNEYHIVVAQVSTHSQVSPHSHACIQSERTLPTYSYPCSR